MHFNHISIPKENEDVRMPKPNLRLPAVSASESYGLYCRRSGHGPSEMYSTFLYSEKSAFELAASRFPEGT